MFTSSGLIVRFLKVFEKSNYHSIKWVRYLTKASGSYQIRVSRWPILFGVVGCDLTPVVLRHRTSPLYTREFTIRYPRYSNNIIYLDAHLWEIRGCQLEAVRCDLE